MMSSKHERPIISNSNTMDNIEVSGMFILNDHKTYSYCKFSKIFLVLQDSDKRIRKNYCKQLLSKFQQACQIYSDDDCNCDREHCDIDCGSQAKNRKIYKDDILTTCRRGVNIVVVNLFRWTDDFVHDLAYIAYQTKYFLLFEPLLAMHKNVMPSIPHLSFGWFVNDTDSTCLREEASLYILDCLRTIPEFGQKYAKYCDINKITNHFHLDDDMKVQEILYCRTCLCPNPEISYKYLNTTPAMKLYSKLDLLHIVGFIISPHFVAARVHLSDKQKEVWQIPDVATVEPSDMINTNQIALRLSCITVPPLTSKVSSTTLRTIGNMPYKMEQLVRTTGRTAHFILGRSRRMRTSETNMEVATVLERAKNSYCNNIGDVGWIDCGKTFAKRFGKYWLLTLKQVLGIDAIFASSCVVD